VGLASTLLNPDVTTDRVAPARVMSLAPAHPVTFAAFYEVPFNLFGSLAAGRTETIFRSPYLDNEIVRLAYQMPEQIRRSPNNALRLIANTRPDLAEIPTDMGLTATSNRIALLLRYSWAKATFKLDYFYNEGVPHKFSVVDPLIQGLRRAGLVGLHKYLHYRNWFAAELSNYVREGMDDVLRRRSPFWNINSLELIRGEQITGHKSCTIAINAVLTLDAVERLLLRSPMATQSQCVDQSACEDVSSAPVACP
jgi:asparagine synthase (glutamine-hydrolysing)